MEIIYGIRQRECSPLRAWNAGHLAMSRKVKKYGRGRMELLRLRCSVELKLCWIEAETVTVSETETGTEIETETEAETETEFEIETEIAKSVSRWQIDNSLCT